MYQSDRYIRYLERFKRTERVSSNKKRDPHEALKRRQQRSKRIRESMKRIKREQNERRLLKK